MFMLTAILTLLVSQSFSSSIRLSEPLVVKTQDGQKYLYHPKMKAAPGKNEQIGSTEEKFNSRSCSWSQWGDFSACKRIGKNYREECKQVRRRTSRGCEGRYHLDVQTCTCPLQNEVENEFEDNPGNFPTDVIPVDRDSTTKDHVEKASTQIPIEKAATEQLKDVLDSNEETETPIEEINPEETTTIGFNEVTNSISETTGIEEKESKAEFFTSEKSTMSEGSGIEKTDSVSEEEIIQNLLNEEEESSGELTVQDSFFDDEETDEMEELFDEDQDYQDYLQNYL